MSGDASTFLEAAHRSATVSHVISDKPSSEAVAQLAPVCFSMIVGLFCAGPMFHFYGLWPALAWIAAIGGAYALVLLSAIRMVRAGSGYLIEPTASMVVLL